MKEKNSELINPFILNAVDLEEKYNEEIKCYINEPTINTIISIFQTASKTISNVANVPVEIKTDLIHRLGQLWSNSGYERRKDLATSLSKTSNYHRNLVDLDLQFMASMLDRDFLFRSLDASLAPAGRASLDGLVRISDTESLMATPSGPIFIIGAGNMTTPVVYALVMSVLTNNLTILKPSAANLIALTEFMYSFNDLEYQEQNYEDAINAIQAATYVLYMNHDSDAYNYLLEKTPLGLVNFWGGKYGLTEIQQRMNRNPNNPSLLVNGPMTGVAVIEDASIQNDSELMKASEDLASNIVLFDQKLCNSPTEAYFIGNISRAIQLAERTGKYLSELGLMYPPSVSDYHAMLTHQIRRSLQKLGSRIFMPLNEGTEWTIVLSEKRSLLDDTGLSDTFSIYERPRFIEIIVLESIDDVIGCIESLPRRECFSGVERVQTVGYHMNNHISLAEKMFRELGIFRIVPLGKSLFRTPLEPLDGKYIAREFVKFHYSA